EKVLATVVRLLEATLIRVGNEEYARENRSYGLTTLRTRHVAIEGSQLRFSFRGKSGKHHEVSVRDRRLAHVMRRLQELPGQELFQYLDEDGQRASIDSDDVNEYLREISGEEFTAKDFRTWAGTVLCAVTLRELEAEAAEAEMTDTKARRTVVEAVKQVAQQLGNTPAVCRACSLPRAIMKASLKAGPDRPFAEVLEGTLKAGVSEYELDSEEDAVLGLLRRRLTAARPHATPR